MTGSKQRPGGAPEGRGGTTDAPGTFLAVGERVVASLLLGVSVVLGVFAESLVSHSVLSRAGAFPAHGVIWLGVAVLGTASLVWLVQSLRGRTLALAAQERAPSGEVAVVLTILLGGALATRWLGLLLAAVLTYVGLLVYYRDRNKIFIAASAVIYVLFIHYGMEVLLRVPLARSPLLDLPF